MILYPAAMRNNLNQNLRALVTLKFYHTGYGLLEENTGVYGSDMPLDRHLLVTGGLRPQWGKLYHILIKHNRLDYRVSYTTQYDVMEDFWKEAQAYSVYFSVEREPTNMRLVSSR